MGLKLLPLILLLSCGQPEYSPWQSNPEDTSLTKKNLNRLGDGGSFTPFSVAITGDPQVAPGALDDVRKAVNTSDVAFTVILGDITDRGLLREWRWVGEVIDRFNEPVLTVVGNHDGLNNGDKIYKEMFGPLNYSFIYKDIKFVMWNNNAYEWKVDIDWLEGEVLSHDKVVVLSHQPPWSGTLSDSVESRWKKIREYDGYIASLHGHVHRYSYQPGQPPVYTVDRVTGTHFGRITFTNYSILLENCKPFCRRVE